MENKRFKLFITSNDVNSFGKSYSISNIEVGSGVKILLFVTVLQKERELFECQEYQTIDQNIETLDMTLICKELVQPYQRGVGI